MKILEVAVALKKSDMDLYTRILHEELRVAMGCTEPIAIAYAAAYACDILGGFPEKIEVHCSGNIIKNVKAVTVPNTGGLKGIEAAALAGAISGRPDLELEILSVLTEEDQQELRRRIDEKMTTVRLLESSHALHIILLATLHENEVSVEIIDSHTCIGDVVHNGKILHRRNVEEMQAVEKRCRMEVQSILEYAAQVPLEDVQDLLTRQIENNCAISEEGLKNPWGECVGMTMCAAEPDNWKTRIIAATAAGSDARMNGCALPVVINSGSGNQGMTASLPVIEHAKSINATREQLLRALCVSNLVSIHQKTGIGRLSAFCGVVCAATGAMAGMAFLDGQPRKVIENAIVNSIANIGGMVCDGAKSSCAAKIASALQCALLGYEMAKRDRVFRPGEGLVKSDVEKTIESIGKMAAEGMAATDNIILNIMISDN